MEKYGNYFIDGITSSSDQKHRLLVLLENAAPDIEAYYFHSLLWQKMENGVWADVLSITREQSQADHQCCRWVSNVHSIDPAKKHAIINVAEGDAPKGSKRINYSYSWREWDLNSNKEIAYLRKCEIPREPFECSNGS